MEPNWKQKFWLWYALALSFGFILKLSHAIELAFPQLTTTSRDMNLQLLKNRIQGSAEAFITYYNAVLALCRQHDRAMADVQIVDWLKAGMRLALFEKLHGEEFLTPQSLLLRTQRLELEQEVLTARQRALFDPVSLSNTPTSSDGYSVPASNTVSPSSYIAAPPYAYLPPLMDTGPFAHSFPVQPSSSSHQQSFFPSQTSSPPYDRRSNAPNRIRNRNRPPIVCYSCGEPGHISPRCPYRPNAWGSFVMAVSPSITLTHRS